MDLKMRNNMCFLSLLAGYIFTMAAILIAQDPEHAPLKQKTSQTSEVRSDTNKTFIITGVVVNADSSPAPCRSIWVSQVGKDCAITFKIKEGKLINPNAETGPNGRFKIEVNREFLKPNNEFLLGLGGCASSLNSVGGIRPKDRIQRLNPDECFVFKVDYKTKEIDLGQIMAIFLEDGTARYILLPKK